MSEGVRPATTLIGRANELEQLRRAWRRTGSSIVVSGPAGVGKSRLTRELAAWAAARGGWVLAGRATASAHATPLRPIAEALLAAARRGEAPPDDLGMYRSVLARLVPDWTLDADPPEELSTLLLGEAVLRFLSHLSADQPGLLVLEDLHWADPETLQVVDYLSDHVEDHRLTVVSTLRVGESGLATDAVQALLRRRGATEIALPPLDDDSVIELASACLVDDDVPEEMQDAIRTRSEGIPFFVEELVATAVSSGWESVAAAVPGSVLSSVELRLEALGDDVRRLLVGAAVQGRSFDWRLTAAACGLDEPSATGRLREAVRAQLLAVEGAGFRFRHALTRDAVLAAALPAERELVASALLDVLDVAEGADVEPCLLGAELAAGIGDLERSASLLTRAARVALESGLLESADRFASRAREQAGPDQRDLVDSLLLEICVQSGDVARGRSLAESLLTGAGTTTDDELRVDRHLLAAALELAGGHWAEAAEHAEAARALLDDDPAGRARADVLAAQSAMGRDDVDAAVVLARRALEGAEATGQPMVQCEAHEVIGRAERGRDLDAAEVAFQRAHDVASSSRLALWRVRALQELGTIDLFDSLRLDRLREARDEALRLGAHGTAAMVDLQLAATHLERGEVAAALETAQRCEATSRRFGLSTAPMSVMLQAMVHARRGDRSAMEAALAAGPDTELDRDYVEASVWGNVEPIFHLVMGDLEAAADALDRGMDVVRRRPAAALPFPGLWALVCSVIDRDGASARAEVDALPFDTPVSRRTLLAAHAVAAGRTGDRTGAAEQFAEADRRLGAPEGAFRRWLVRLVVAPAAHVDGWGEPEVWLRESLVSFEQMELATLAGRCRHELKALGATVPRRSAVASVAVPPMLAGAGVTGRETEVLRLVAEGATNREIAERLVVSARTVDKHVERLLQKTGVSRAGLRDVALEAGLLAPAEDRGLRT